VLLEKQERTGGQKLVCIRPGCKYQEKTAAAGNPTLNRLLKKCRKELIRHSDENRIQTLQGFLDPGWSLPRRTSIRGRGDAARWFSNSLQKLDES